MSRRANKGAPTLNDAGLQMFWRNLTPARFPVTEDDLNYGFFRDENPQCFKAIQAAADKLHNPATQAQV